jgi:hypothetical protein
MTSLGWSFVEITSHLLERDEREVVLGDLMERGESAWQAALDVLGLLVRRQLDIWKSWRPWLAAFGLALPGSMLLMGFSISVSEAYQNLIGPSIFRATGLALPPGLTLLLCNVLLLVAWSWTGGFVVGSLSRRTIRVSALLSFGPCLFCLARFRIETLSRFCLLLFLFPAMWGVYRGLQVAQIKLRSAIILAVTITILTIPTWGNRGSWIPNWALSWPTWYLVAVTWRRAATAKEREWRVS